MIFELSEATTGGVCGHGNADGPFIDCGRLVLLEEGWGNEWLENEPATEIDAK